MTDTTDGETAGSTDSDIRIRPGDREAIEAVGTYKSDGGVVFYDMENPLAWVQSRRSIELENAR